MKRITIKLYDGQETITVTLEERLGIETGQIDSTLMMDEDYDDKEGDADKYNQSVQGMLSLILSLACMGINIEDPKFIAGIEGTHTELTEQYGE